jgi:RAT1-interacting protein
VSIVNRLVVLMASKVHSRSFQFIKRNDGSNPVHREQTSSLAYPKGPPNAKQVPFQQPSQLISFSYNPEHVQEFTDSALRYFVDPPIGSHLGYGYERWNYKSDDRGRIDALLKAVSKIKSDTAACGGALPEIGLISWRGVMTK